MPMQWICNGLTEDALTQSNARYRASCLVWCCWIFPLLSHSSDLRILSLVRASLSQPCRSSTLTSSASYDRCCNSKFCLDAAAPISYQQLRMIGAAVQNSFAMPPQRHHHSNSNMDSSFMLPAAATKMAPLHAIHIVGRCLRLVSVYAAYHYVVGRGVSLTFFTFVCLLGSAAMFFIIQRPWRGRPLPNNVLVPAVLNGGVMAFSLLLWANGLRNCGPVRTVLGEYAGAVLGAISTVLFSRNGLVWRRVGGLLAMCAAYYFLSQGWAMSSYSPFSFGSASPKVETVEAEEGLIQSSSMLMPALSGILAAIRRIISRRLSTKNHAKKRLHAVTVAAATCFIFPLAMFNVSFIHQSSSTEPQVHAAWACSSTILFGIVLIFYVDTFIEDRLHIVVASPTHIMVTGVGIIIFEYLYGTDFSLLGFLVCATVLGIGIFEATATDNSSRDLDQGNSFLKEDRPPVNISTLPS